MGTMMTTRVAWVLLFALCACGCGSTARSTSGPARPKVPAATRRAILPTTTTRVPSVATTGVTTTSVSSTTVSSTSVSSTSVAPSAPSGSAESDAVRVVRSLGYTPVDTDDFTYPDFDYGLHVIIGYATGSATGYAQRAFFLVHGRYVGTDVTEPSATVRLVWRTDATIALGYTIYKVDDAMCCPLGGAVTVRYQWTGARLEALDPIPSPDLRR